MIRVGIAGIGYIAEEYIKLFSQGKIKNAECEYSCRMRNPERQGLKDLKRLEMA